LNIQNAIGFSKTYLQNIGNERGRRTIDKSHKSFIPYGKAHIPSLNIREDMKSASI